MNKKILISVALILVLGVSINFAMLHKSENDSASSILQLQPESQPISVSKTEESIKWYSMSEALELQKQTNKKIFIDVYTNWCGPCKWFSANTLSNPVIEKALTDYFIPVKFNAEGKDTVLYKGKSFVNPKPDAGPRQSTHELTFEIASTPQGIAYPTIVFMDEELNIIQPIQGALQSAELEPILAFFGTDAYKTIQWEEFKKTFKSAISVSN